MLYVFGAVLWHVIIWKASFRVDPHVRRNVFVGTELGVVF